MKNNVWIFLVAALALSLGACSSQPAKPSAEDLQLDLSQAWQAANTEQTASKENPLAADENWWLEFNSPQLNQLIAQAQKNSPDMLSAHQVLLQAQAQLGITNANQLPHLNANLNASSSKTGSDASRKSSSAGFSTSYEIDLWGKLRAERTAASALFTGQIYAWHSTRLSLSAAVASSWFTWLAATSQVDNAQTSLEAAEEQYRLIKARFDQGGATQLDLARQERQLISRQSNLLRLEETANQAKNALALLLGEQPQTFNPPSAEVLAIYPPKPNAFLMADLLSRRPDLASQEAQLLAAQANIQVAKKAIYPSLSLQASASWASNNLNFGDPDFSRSLSAGLTQSVFDFGVRKRQIKLSEAKAEEMLINYRKAVLTALVEVENALTATATNQQLNQLSQTNYQHSSYLAEQSLKLYEAGAEKLADLLDAQQDELQALDSLTTSHLAELEASLNLYKALGGGWQKEEKEEIEETKPNNT